LNRDYREKSTRCSQQLLKGLNAYARCSGLPLSTQSESRFNKRCILCGHLKVPHILQANALETIESDVFVDECQKEEAGTDRKDVTRNRPCLKWPGELHQDIPARQGQAFHGSS
jgi:hypothetical protein